MGNSTIFLQEENIEKKIMREKLRCQIKIASKSLKVFALK